MGGWSSSNIADLLSPYFTYLFRLSLDTGRFSAHIKSEFLMLILKENVSKGNNPLISADIQVISCLETTWASGGQTTHPFLEDIQLPPTFQLGLWRDFSTETAITKMPSGLYDAVDRVDSALLALLDLSAACDTVDHEIILERLRHSCGIGDLACAQLIPVVPHWSNLDVRCGSVNYHAVRVVCGVSQRSGVGPYTLQSADQHQLAVIAKFGPALHQYADNSQLYGDTSDRLVRKDGRLNQGSCWLDAIQSPQV